MEKLLLVGKHRMKNIQVEIGLSDVNKKGSTVSDKCECNDITRGKQRMFGHHRVE